MGTANLALVFGPTLTLAPADIDPRRLHNDVPAVNVLIQTCLEHHEFLFQFDQTKSPEDLPSPNNKSKSPDAFAMSPCKSPITFTHEPLPRPHSPMQSSPMVHTPTPPMVHTPTPPPASKESEAEPMPKEEGERDEGNEAKDKTEAEEEEEEEEDDDTDLDTDEGERNV